jgi:tRNA (cmo5U34)-methyltransferase
MSEETIEKLENMAAFFDARAAGYDDHMRAEVFTKRTFTQFYQALAEPIEETSQAIKILDLGCGTGLELEALFHRTPHAVITGIDVSENILALLQERYADRMNQIQLVTDSYLTKSFGRQTYDYIVSAFSSHHLLTDAKRKLYEKIHTALKPGGKYIEGDSIIPVAMEGQFLAEYQQQTAVVPPAEDGYYHIDIPFSIETQRSLLPGAGFQGFEIVWQTVSEPVWNMAVYVAIR